MNNVTTQTAILSHYPTYARYKDSGVDWLGQIPEEWKLVPAFNFIRENKEKNSELKETTVLSLSYGNIIIKPKEKLTGLVPESFETYQVLRPDDIVIRCTDLQNDRVSLRTGLVKNQGMITNAYLGLKVSKQYNSKFLHYFLHSLDTSKAIYAMGTGLRQNLSFNDFKRFLIPNIHLKEQTAIANFITQKTAQIDQAISLKEQQIAKLEEYKQILIQNAVTKGLNPDVPMKDSGIDWIGEIPKHWEVRKTTHIFRKIGSGTTPASGNSLFYESGEFNWLQTGDLNNGKIYSTSRKITQKALSAYSTLKIYDIDSLVIAMYGATIGKVGLLKIQTSTNQACCVLEKSPIMNMEYAFYLFQACKNHLISQSYGGGQPNISQDLIRSLRLPCPPIDEQTMIADKLATLNQTTQQGIQTYQTQIDRLKEYKTILIHQAVTGKIKVTDSAV